MLIQERDIECLSRCDMAGMQEAVTPTHISTREERMMGIASYVTSRGLAANLYLK